MKERSERLRRRLLPRPRRLSLTEVSPEIAAVIDGAAPPPRRSGAVVPARSAVDAELPAGACRIVVARDPAGGGEVRITVTVAAADAATPVAPGAITGAGGRRATAILTQLARVLGPSEQWPGLHIEDRPRIARRGVMLDVSRDRVPTVATLLGRIAGLGELGFDHLQLYTEHTFAYAGCATVWGEASPVTPEEMRRFDAAAAAAGIELAANQNCFGHLHRWLRDPAFADLAETHGAFDFFGAVRHGPFSLCPIDPRSLEFVRDRLHELVPTTTSPHVNIGCDETADVGTGRSRAAVARRGKAAVERAFVAAVAGVVRNLGRTPMFWADMALRDPEGLAELPPELIALAWGYEDDRRIADAAATLAERGRPFWVCPGTSTWRSLGGRPAERRGNLRRAATAAVEHGAGGMLVTDWGDCGHRQPWVLTQHALGEAAALAWDPDDPHAGRDEAIAVHLLGQPDGGLGPWLRAVGDVDREVRRRSGPPAAEGGEATPLHNATALFEDLHPSGLPTGLPRDADVWAEVVDRIDELAGSMPSIAGEPVRAEVEHVVATMAFAARRAAWRRDPAARADPARQDDLRQRLAAVIEGHDRLWAAESRPGGAADGRRWWTDLDGASGLVPPPTPGT
jgi:hypothetical protein